MKLQDLYLGGKMTTVLLVFMVISRHTLIGSVLLQEGSSAGMGSAISGGAEGLFGKESSWHARFTQ